MNKKLLYACSYCLGFFLIISCNAKKEIIFNDQNLIIGNATPVLIHEGINEINLSDYVVDLSKIDSISVPAGLSSHRNNEILIVEGNIKNRLAEIILWHQQQAYAIPVQRANKSKIILRYPLSANEVKVKGEFNAWNANATILRKSENEFSTELLLNPGNYQYLFVVDGKEVLDPFNKDSIDNGMGGWNSIIKIKRADVTKLPILSTQSFSDQEIILFLQQPATELKVYWKNFLLDESLINHSDKNITIIIPQQASKERRTFIRVWAANEEGISTMF